jgi:hypothetical protein
MTRAAKVVYLIALVLGTSGGVVAGYRTTLPLLESLGEAKHTVAPGELYEFALMQYTNADTEHARASLLSLANFLEEMEKEKSEGSVRRDLSLTYVGSRSLKIRKVTPASLMRT